MSRWSELADLLREAGSGLPVATAVCRLAAEVLGAERAGVVLVDTERRPAGTVATDPVGATLLAEEFLLGEGPAVRAVTTGLPVLAVDLAADRGVDRGADRAVDRGVDRGAPGAGLAPWPLYAAAAEAAGVAAAFAFPLRLGAVTLGVLVVLRGRPGPPTPAAYADALVVADLAVQALLAERAAGRDGLPASFAPGLADHDLVHEAAGMVAERAGIPLGDALVRIRARAFADGLTVAQVARGVVAGTLDMEG